MLVLSRMRNPRALKWIIIVRSDKKKKEIKIKDLFAVEDNLSSKERDKASILKRERKVYQDTRVHKHAKHTYPR